MASGSRSATLDAMTNHLTQAQTSAQTRAGSSGSAPTAAAAAAANENRSALSRTAVRRLIVVAASAVAAIAVWALEDPLGGLHLAVDSRGTTQDIGPVAVVATPMLVGLAAWGLLAIFERRLRRPHRAWTILAAVVFVVSLLGPASGVGASAKLGLAALHVVVAAALILGLPATRSRTR
jgi:Family of unknown function (DUF6069)